MRFAYTNKDEPKHKFEEVAIEKADEIIEKHGGLEKLIKEL